MKTKLTQITFAMIGFLAINCHADDVRSAVTGEAFVADFYSPKTPSGKPGILYLGGSEGGRPQPILPQFFADNGFPVLAVAYFKEKDLPDTLQMIPLEYFDPAIAWMKRNTNFSTSGIVIVGASKGAELALLLATRKPEIKGVIALSPSSVVWDGLPKQWWPPNPASSWSLNNKPVAFVPYDYSQGFADNDPLAIFKFYQRSLTQMEAVAKAAIPVELIHGPVLLASGLDDQLWPAAEMADAICARLKKSGFEHPYENFKYKDAGHTLNERFMLGGTFEGNQKARMDVSGRMLAFLKRLER